MQRFINILAIFVIFAMTLIPAVGRAASSSVYIAQVSCEGGVFGLRLPQHLPDVMKLGPIEREEINEVEKWDGYTTTRKYVYFTGTPGSGLAL